MRAPQHHASIATWAACVVVAMVKHAIIQRQQAQLASLPSYERFFPPPGGATQATLIHSLLALSA